MSTEEVKAAETLGLIQGLADVVKIQQSTFQTQQATYLEALQKTNQQLSSLSETVELLSKSVPKSTLSAGSGLRLPNVTLPEFTEKQNLDRFMAQMESLLLSSGVPLRFWLTYLKQQCQKDSRAFDALIAAEKEHSSILGSDPSKATDEEYESYYKACVTVLKAKCGIPQDQQIRELLSQYYIMKQHPRESVADFSHRFSEVQNELEKLIPGIHRTVDGNELELIHAFSIKLLPVISKEIVSREFTYKTLQELIVVATRYEQNILPGFKEMTLGNPLPDAIYTNTAQGGTRPRIKGSNASSNFSDGKFAGRKPAANTGNRFNDVKPRENPRSNEICFPYNKYSSAHCQLPDGKCKNGRIHKCTVCHKPGCKALKHQSKHSPAQANFAFSESIESVRNDKIDKILDILQTQIPSQNSTALSSHVGKVEQTIQPNLSGPTPAQSQGGVFCSPAVVQALPSQSQVTELNLANRHILWAPVTSAGVKLPLPLDSCCSLSLVSKPHAELVSQKCPNLCYKKLATPLPVSVASPDSQLQAVGIMQIPITWENGICSTFSMLVVPGLSWPILFGQNHLHQTKAITDHDGLIVHFNHPSMQFAIKCGDSNPLASFQNLSSQNSTQGSSGSATIACMLTSVPPPTQPREHIVLHMGFNLVTFCLVMASTLVGNPLFSTPLWLEGSSIFPGVNVVSGPIDLKSFASSPVHSQFPQFLLPSYNHPKCRPSQPLPDPDPEPTVSGILTSQDSLISQPFAPMIDYEQVYYTTVLVRSTQDKTVLPLNANLGVVRSRTSEDDLIWQDAADHTAEQLSDTWLNFVTSQPSWFACHTSPVQPNYAGCASRSWKLAQQKSEMARAGLDSSILSPFLPEPESDHPHAFPPTDSGGLEPHSEEYFNKLVQALELDSPIYSHVDPLIMEKFKALLRKYPEAFYLPGSQLGTMKGFYHNIDTGQSPPVYRLPYRKSPAELCAIKNELQKMLSQGIIKPSHSPWGAPCILVRKPPEKGIPQPPRFVVDYRGLNAGTSDITPFFLVFGREAPSPESISLALPPKPLPPDHYAKHIISRMADAHRQFSQIKADLRRQQHDIYNEKARIISIPDGKIVYIRNDSPSRIRGLATRFIRNFDGPYVVTGHPYGRTDLLTLRHIASGKDLSHPINIEKVVIIPEPEFDDLQPPNDAVIEMEVDTSKGSSPGISTNSDLNHVAREFGKYLDSLPSKTSTASQACKYVYENYPASREILARHGKLKGLIKSCPFLQMEGATFGGTYILSLNQTLFNTICKS